MLLFSAGKRPSCRCAAEELGRRGVALCDHVSPEITHLLLDIPSNQDIGELLSMLPEKITVIGGNLSHLEGRKKIDLLQDEVYLAQNAAITADCALKVARDCLDTAWFDTKALIIGWGRIGKTLAPMLKSLGAEVTVAARKEKDRAMIAALGYRAAEVPGPEGVDVVFNTVPALVWPHCPVRVKIDLASQQGLTGEDIHWARGLPGILASRTTGRLMAQRILEIIKEETL